MNSFIFSKNNGGRLLKYIVSDGKVVHSGLYLQQHTLYLTQIK